MERIASNFNYTRIENILYTLGEDHSSSALFKLKNEINRLFPRATCKEILYTNNTDKLFFGMRVYGDINGDDAIEVFNGEKPKRFERYYIEFDSKLFNPMLNLDEKELTAMLLHEIGHIVYDTGTIDEVRKNIDMYFTKTGDYMPNNVSKSYKELLAYAIKDAVMKVGSLFAKFGNEEMIADSFVISCGYGAYLDSAFRKLSASTTYINKNVDNSFITLSWALRLKNELNIRRLPAIKTLNKAKQLTGSELEKREINYAVEKLSRIDDVVEEGAFENVKNRFSKKFADFKLRGVRAIRNDVFELNLRLRTADNEDDLLYIIRTVNSDVSILRDYLTEPDVPDDERKEIEAALQELYSLREKAAKEKQVKDRYASIINITYPELS